MATPAYAYTRAFTQTHSIVFLSDNLRNTLREVIRENGISPNKLMQDWGTIERGIRTWLQSGHLMNVVVEFSSPAHPRPRRAGNSRLDTRDRESMTICGWTRTIFDN
jgi:Bacterial HORMA domain 2